MQGLAEPRRRFGCFRIRLGQHPLIEDHAEPAAHNLQVANDSQSDQNHAVNLLRDVKIIDDEC